MKSAELKQQRKAKIDAQTAIVTKAEGENRELSADETQQFDALQREIEGFTEKITRAEKFEANQRMAAESGKAPAVRTPAPTPNPNEGAEGGEGKEKRAIARQFSVVKMLRSAMEGQPLDGAEKETHEIGLEENRAAQVPTVDSKRGMRVMVPMSFARSWAGRTVEEIKRATQQTVTQDAGDYGSEFVQEGAPRVVAGLEPKLFIQQLGATVLSGLSGGNIKMPVANSYDFAWLAEGDSLNVQKKQFTGPVLSPKRAGASVSLTNQLLMQSSIDVEALVRMKMGQGYSKLINGAAINGGGGNAPTGILGYAGVNAAADVAHFAATYAKIVELQGLIMEDDATEQSLGYLVHPKLAAALKTKSKDAGSGRFLLENNAIDGFRYVSTSLVPVGDDAGTPIYPVIFGDFAQLYVGQWGSMAFMVNPYSEDLADSVRITLNTHADVQIANPKAFARNGFFNAN